jgi:hypothetical protein
MGFLGIGDEEFWGKPLARAPQLCDQLFDQGVLGPLLDAPARVALERHDSLPVVVCQCDTYRVMRSVDLRRASVLCVSRPDRNETKVGLAFSPEELGQQGPPPGPKDKVPEGTGVVMFIIDARERLDLAWERGPLLLTLLLAGKASNRAQVELVPPPRFEDPEVARYVAEHRQVPYPRHVSPPLDALAKLPVYRRTPESPATPPPPSIALAAPEVVVLGESCVLRGAVRVRPRPGEVVRPRPEAPEPVDLPEGFTWQDPGDPEATAVVPVTLVVAGTDAPDPRVILVQVPSYDPIPDPSAPPEVELTFALDLFRVAEFADAQACFVYAFTGASMGGPVRIAMISRSALRGE